MDTYRIVFTQRNTMATTFSPGVEKGGDAYFLKAVSENGKSRQHVGYATIRPDKLIEVATVSGGLVGIAHSRDEARRMIDTYHRIHNADDYWTWTTKTLKGQPPMPLSDTLDRDYAAACTKLSEVFGGQFEIISTGGGFYAIHGRITEAPTFKGETQARVGDHILITAGNDAGLNPMCFPGGYGVGIYEDDGGHTGEQVVYYADPDAEGADDMHDLVAIAIYIRTVQGRNY